ncbi:hypothetical protein Ciccas_006086 [Cichlidogyrus casuarinus]|uniref:Uncharacterized protein n=1 Tax=Cichlidogyrus casuarinus TaxID=1844966 RepID=A0ABD2Q6V0_9PLAT
MSIIHKDADIPEYLNVRAPIAVNRTLNNLAKMTNYESIVGCRPNDTKYNLMRIQPFLSHLAIYYQENRTFFNCYSTALSDAKKNLEQAAVYESRVQALTRSLEEEKLLVDEHVIFSSREKEIAEAHEIISANHHDLATQLESTDSNIRVLTHNNDQLLQEISECKKEIQLRMSQIMPEEKLEEDIELKKIENERQRMEFQKSLKQLMELKNVENSSKHSNVEDAVENFSKMVSTYRHLKEMLLENTSLSLKTEYEEQRVKDLEEQAQTLKQSTNAKEQSKTQLLSEFQKRYETLTAECKQLEDKSNKYVLALKFM